ncbi:MAG: hypothetical protein F6J93_33665 [Oscillatoria sp. SIO1A7]|nr:hypothetical protein [Oscillatoria sp. SIO1A7]
MRSANRLFLQKIEAYFRDKQRSQRMVGNGLVTDVTDDCEMLIAYFCKK